MELASVNRAKAPSTLIKVLVVLVGACFGIMTLSGLVKVAYPILDPDGRLEGQSGFDFVLSMPIGMILGAVGGYELMRQRTKTPRHVLAVAGALSTTLVLAIGVLSAGSRGLSVLELLWTVASPWCLLPLIASLATLIAGLLSNKRG
jgi:hypothetical protein